MQQTRVSVSEEHVHQLARMRAKTTLEEGERLRLTQSEEELRDWCSKHLEDHAETDEADEHGCGFSIKHTVTYPSISGTHGTYYTQAQTCGQEQFVRFSANWIDWSTILYSSDLCHSLIRPGIGRAETEPSHRCLDEGVLRINGNRPPDNSSYET
mgnify:CR=1 FL=1